MVTGTACLTLELLQELSSLVSASALMTRLALLRRIYEMVVTDGAQHHILLLSLLLGVHKDILYGVLPALLAFFAAFHPFTFFDLVFKAYELGLCHLRIA